MTPPHAGVRIHPTAEIEDGVEIGAGTAIWSGVHVRGPGTRIGVDCIVGERTHIAYGVQIGDRVKLNAFVYVCTGVTIENGVMIGAGTIFTNDRYPRATTPDLATLRPSEPDERTLPTLVGEGRVDRRRQRDRLRPVDRSASRSSAWARSSPAPCRRSTSWSASRPARSRSSPGWGSRSCASPAPVRPIATRWCAR